MEDAEKLAKFDEMSTELETLRPLKDTSEKLTADFKVKEDAWLKEKADLESQVNPNWKKTREQLDRLKQVAQERGVKFGEDGEIVDGGQKGPTKEEIEATVSKQTRQELLNARLDEILEDYDAKDAGVIKVMYDKLIAGEEVTMQNIKKFVKQAEDAAGLKPKAGARNFSGGQGPRITPESTGLPAKEAEGLAKLMGINIGKDDNK